MLSDSVMVLTPGTGQVKMSPFSVYLSELRIRHGLRQTKLAALLGYEQGYISALELGTKGPSNEEFLARLVQVFKLTDQEQAELALAVKQSGNPPIFDAL